MLKLPVVSQCQRETLVYPSQYPPAPLLNNPFLGLFEQPENRRKSHIFLNKYSAWLITIFRCVIEHNDIPHLVGILHCTNKNISYRFRRKAICFPSLFLTAQTEHQYPPAPTLSPCLSHVSYVS